MMNLILATLTFIRITSIHDVTMTIDNDYYMSHKIYNYDYSVIYVDETYKLDEKTGEWIRQ